MTYTGVVFAESNLAIFFGVVVFYIVNLYRRYDIGLIMCFTDYMIY